MSTGKRVESVADMKSLGYAWYRYTTWWRFACCRAMARPGTVLRLQVEKNE